MSGINHIHKYIQYLLFSKHSRGHGIHSPFVFDFVTSVLRGPDKTDYGQIEKLKEELRNDLSQLNIIDLGAGSRAGAGTIRSTAYIVNHTSINPKYGRFLARLVDWLSPSTIIELGTGVAFSTMYMAAASEHSKIFSIEGCPEIAELAESNVKKLGFINTDIITGSFDKILPSLYQKIQHNLLVFIDGDHRGYHLISYFESILPFTNENSVFVFDDIRWSGSMEKAWKDIIKRKEISVSIDLYRMGIVFMKNNLFKQDYVIRF
jgi:predicted O-methyltransferase YrrM